MKLKKNLDILARQENWIWISGHIWNSFGVQEKSYQIGRTADSHIQVIYRAVFPAVSQKVKIRGQFDCNS